MGDNTEQFKDGAIYLKLLVNNFKKVLMRVFGIGKDCKVIQTKLLINDFIYELKGAVRNYLPSFNLIG